MSFSELNISFVIPARGEGVNIIHSVKSILRQKGFRGINIIVVNDGLSRDIIDGLKGLGCIVIDNPVKHDVSWVGTPGLAFVLNLGILRVPWETDYMVISGADTIYEKNYLGKIVGIMEGDKRIVIASGVILGEKLENFPRGSGRVIRYSWWRRHIRLFPLIYGWEDYPVYKAMSRGYRVVIVREAKMIVSRPTWLYKPFYGCSMRQLGYYKPYVLFRFMNAFLIKPVNAIMMLAYYLGCRRPVYDEGVSGFLRYYQSRRLARMLFGGRIL